MRNYLLLLFIILIGCTTKNNTESKDQEYKGDTLLINNVVFFLDSISEKEYLSAEKQNMIDFKEEIIDDTLNVKRDSLKLVFHLKNGADSIAIDDTTEGWSSFISYNYLQSCNYIDYWLLKIIFYEGGQYMLIDKEDGSRIWIWGIPIYSPDRKLFVCYSWDLEAAYDHNGFQLFEIINNKSVLKWWVEMDDWGPSEIRWKNASTIYIEQTRMDYQKSGSPYVKTYKSMKIR